MILRKEFIDPGKTLVEAASDWLVARAETVAEGAKSLERLLVIVPTAQSGRSLRLALARKAAERGWGGIMPPAISMPDLLLVDALNDDDILTVTYSLDTLRVSHLYRMRVTEVQCQGLA